MFKGLWVSSHIVQHFEYGGKTREGGGGELKFSKGLMVRHKKR